MKIRTLLLLLALGIAVSACVKPARRQQQHDIFTDLVDTSVAPGENFFLYSVGKWIKNNPIPAEESSWGIANLVIEENRRRLKEVNESAAKSNNPAGSAEQKIGDFWVAAMDSQKIEQEGLAPLATVIRDIDEALSLNELALVCGKLARIGVSTPISWYVDQDEMNSSLIRFKLYQGGIYLNEREYYFKTDNAGLAILEGYKTYLAKMLELSGMEAVAAAKRAAEILAMETRLAGAHKKLEDTRDPYQNYNALSYEQVKANCPGFDWNRFLEGLKAPAPDTVMVAQPAYYQALDKEWKSNELQFWKDFLKFRLLDEYAVALPAAFGDARFAFSSLISGATQQQARWKRVLQAEESIMGELLGQLFVKEYFTETAKNRYENLVGAVKAAYKKRISGLDWMSDATKQRAYTKLHTMTMKVGYPEKWKDFSSMDINRNGFVRNIMAGNAWWASYYIAKIGNPVNKDEWNMYPQTYNAYYNPANNEIVLPAGIFTVPGFRDEELDDAVVFGYAAASTIGHEITHGFDDQGRLFDEKGNLADWWTKEDSEKFAERAKGIISQFDTYEVVDGLHINGNATQGENIADLGGILLGIDAFKETEQYKKNERKGGFTPLQRYFLGYSLGWMYHSRPEALRNQVISDVHSPASFRVNGPFVNVDDFYTAFDIQPGAALYVAPEKRVRIW